MLWMMRALSFLFTTLAGIWFVLSGNLSIFFIGSGLFACGFTLYILRKMGISEQEEKPLYLRLGILPYGGWLFIQMLQATVAVICAAWQKKPRISPTLAWIPSEIATAVGQATYANSITLTPGTVCTHVEDGFVQVHALAKENIAALRQQRMDRQIKKFFRYG